jgi:hypothetical protein
MPALTEKFCGDSATNLPGAADNEGVPSHLSPFSGVFRVLFKRLPDLQRVVVIRMSISWAGVAGTLRRDLPAIRSLRRPGRTLPCRPSVRGHRSEIMFSVLVVVLGPDFIARLEFGLG